MPTNGKSGVDEFIRNLQLISHLTRHYIEGQWVDEASEKPLSFVHMNLLRILDEYPGQTVGDIAKYMHVSYPAATKTIDKLVRLGFLRRREDSKDRRIAHLHLTASGKKLVERYQELKRNQISSIMDSIGPEKSEEFSEQMIAFARRVVDSVPIRSGICMHCGAFDPTECTSSSSEKTCGYLDSVNKTE